MLEKLMSKDMIAVLGLGGVLALAALGLVIGALAFLGKFGFGELSARYKIQRDFAGSTGQQIAALANQHYWAIANAAGTLSVGLRSYLEAVEIRLYLRWASRESLREELARVADRASFDTFPSLVQLVWSLHSFQFVGSNDYLLPHRSASTHLRRLYNGFRRGVAAAAIDGGDDLATGLLQNGKSKDGKFDLEATLDAASRKHRQSPEPRRAEQAPAENAPAEANGLENTAEKLADDGLERLRRAWAGWLVNNLPSVLSATDSLEAFSRLLQHELADLYEDWFRDKKVAGELAKVERAVERRTWFGMLTRAELATLAVAREEHDFMTALRRTAGGLPQPGDRPEPKKRGEEDQPHEGGPDGGGGPLGGLKSGEGAARAAGAEAFIHPDQKFFGGKEAFIRPDQKSDDKEAK